MPPFPQSWPLPCGCDWDGESFCGFECLSVFTLTGFSVALMSFNYDCVASAVLAISIALVKVSDESLRLLLFLEMSQSLLLVPVSVF